MTEEKKNFFSMTSQERATIFTDAVQKEISMHHAAGRATPHADERGVYLFYPDGHKEYIDEELKPKS